MFKIFKRKKPESKTPHMVRVPINNSASSAIEYHPTECKCTNCGATFIAWFGQQKCPWCYTNHTDKITTIRCM